MMKLNTMRTRLDGLVIFRGILQANIVPAFRAMLAAAGSEDFVSAAADFENQLFERGGSWTRVLLDAVLQDENICIRKAASGGATLHQLRHSRLTYLADAGNRPPDTDSQEPPDQPEPA